MDRARCRPAVERVRGRPAPDYASVNLSEDGAAQVMRTLIEIGVGAEAAVWTVEDVPRLEASGVGGDVLRILIEPGDVPAAGALYDPDGRRTGGNAALVRAARKLGAGAGVHPLREPECRG
jgi:uncharacterized protein (DUF849 family)